MYRTAACILFFFLSVSVRSQQLPLYSQYMLNQFMINPAVAGADGYTSFNLTAREQWLGLTGAPETRSFSGQTRLLRRSYIIKHHNVNNKRLKPSTKGRVGLGGYFYFDKNGPVERVGMQGTYAYHIFIQDIQFSMGISGGLYQFRVRDEDLFFLDEDDPLLLAGLHKVLYVPDINVGFNVLANNYNIGFSVNQLSQSYLKLGNRTLSNYRLLRHYYIMGGYRFPLGRDYIFEPSMLLKGTEKLNVQADLTAKIFYKEDYWIGTTYRTGGTMIALAGIRFNQFYFGYAFDYDLTSIRKYSWGSHEVVVGLKFGDNARRYRWLNRY